MTPDQIKAGHTYECIGNHDCLVLSVGDDCVTYRDCYGVAESGLADFARACVRDITPAPESDQGEKVAQAQNLEPCGDSVAERAFARDVAEYLYRDGHHDNGPGNSEGTRLLRLAREIAQKADAPPVAAVNADLLAALHGLLDALPSATTHPAIKAARAAIAKAEAGE